MFRLLSNRLSTTPQLTASPQSRLKEFSIHLRSWTVVLLTVLCTISSPANSLGGVGRVEGTVTDPSGARVGGARVTLRKGTIVSYQTRSDNEGRFVFADVEEGSYDLTVVADGLVQGNKKRVSVTADQTEDASVLLDLGAITEQLVVSATRTETPGGELPGSFSVISRRDLRRTSVPVLSESLRLVPGVAVVQSGGRGAITSVFTRGGESDYNKVLIDGVPVNAGGGPFDFFSLTPENLDRVEVVRGPGSALFGSDAVTSVIHLITRRGSTQTPELELSSEGGSLNSHRETAQLAGLVRWFDYSASFGYQTTDGRYRNSDFLNRSLSANLGFQIAPNATLRITSRSNNNSLGVAGPTEVLFPDPDQRQKHRNVALTAGLDLKTSARWHQTARFIYAEADTNSFDPAAQDLTQPDTPPIPPGGFGVDFASFFRDHQQRAGLHYQSIISVSSNVISTGLDFERESADFTSDFSRSSPSRNNVGVYLQDQVSWGGRLFLSAGLRVEHNSGNLPSDFRAALESLDSSAPTGDVGFGYSVNPKVAGSVVLREHGGGVVFGVTTLRGSAGTAIKEPRLDEAFSPSTFFLGNPALEPERARSFDLGLLQEFFDRRGRAEITYFDNRFRDLIVFRFDPETFGPIRLPDGRLTNFINLDRASARGIEMYVAARPLVKFQLSGSYTFLRSRLEPTAGESNPEAGLSLVRRPRHSGTFEVSWIDERFDATVGGSLVGKRRDLDPITGVRFDVFGRPIFNEGYAKINMAGTYKLTRGLTTFLRVENLLNRDYQEVLGFPAYRLNFSVGLRLRIGGDL